MIGSGDSSKMMALSGLLDAAIGTPEPGCVNFTILHTFLSAILKHLSIEDLEASVDRTIFESINTRSPTSLSISEQKKYQSFEHSEYLLLSAQPIKGYYRPNTSQEKATIAHMSVNS
ncbi:hypothetical protein EG68_02381 [Paragonimus skrjabini miyazakii]|uniref:Uncharacterized protein n=1 Tax=Paragonimus skrjabini miyazakii TaxID=59628 RepID=A0A8S9Z8L6_9TREM|nr:hypothetical protein EG68_02381 [Paragonimus skrjabini miyazakii]